MPLHVWLPDAMEGPTPVSALIHAATMVAAGVFLVARTLPLFEHSLAAMNTVAVIGGFTAIFAATMGLVAVDIKRVLAYSTVSQLGYMMLGLATGGVAVGIFHLFNHAFFKALLFLGAGSVNHATGTFDMREMGGLRKVMPWTYGLFIIASLSLAGIWPLAGFWSKDEVLAAALDKQPVLFVMAMITVFMTAFYMFRLIFLTFFGQARMEEEVQRGLPGVPALAPGRHREHGQPDGVHRRPGQAPGHREDAGPAGRPVRAGPPGDGRGEGQRADGDVVRGGAPLRSTRRLPAPPQPGSIAGPSSSCRSPLTSTGVPSGRAGGARRQTKGPALLRSGAGPVRT
jgi:NADH:ubiquinone oxidoreductase subunit 5 (subunit L)/multisubunit Na+/H+ antiporter MnhA subunit